MSSTVDKISDVGKDVAALHVVRKMEYEFKVDFKDITIKKRESALL